MKICHQLEYLHDCTRQFTWVFPSNMGQFKLAQPALPLEQTKIRERATQNCLNWTVIHWYAPKIGENIIVYYLDSVSQTWFIINKDEEYSKTDFCNLISFDEMVYEMNHIWTADMKLSEVMIFAVMSAILQLRREGWKIQDFNGVWTRDLAIPVRRSNQLSYEATDVGSWSFVGSNGPVRNE